MGPIKTCKHIAADIPWRAGVLRRPGIPWRLVQTLAIIITTAASFLAEAERRVVICNVSDMVDDGLAVIIKRAVEEAKEADALVLVIDTYGGLVDSALEITDTLLHAPTTTVAYIRGKGAISAGALIAFACDAIFMAPDSNIGASTPLEISAGGEQNIAVTEKSMSYLRSRYRMLAENKGHNPLLGEAMVDADIELWGALDDAGYYSVYRVEADRVVDVAVACPKKPRFQLPTPCPTPTLPPDHTLPPSAELITKAGKLLTLTSQEALQCRLAFAVADNLDAVLKTIQCDSAARVIIEPTVPERIFRFLTSPWVQALLLMAGLAALYLEFKTPGLSIAGLIAAVCFMLFFGAGLVFGIAEWLDVLLFLTGVALLAVELFLIPGFGVVGVSGIVCIVAAVYLALVRAPIPQYTWEMARLEQAVTTLAGAAVLFAGFVAVVWRYFPRTPLFQWLVLTAAEEKEQGYTVQTPEDTVVPVGARGVAETLLRPAGRARFGAVTVDVVTRGEYVEPRTPVEVVEVVGNRYVVAAVPERQAEERQRSPLTA